MSKSLNKVQLIGHVGKDPVVRTTQGGKLVAGFSLATNEGGKDNERTEWHNIIAWEKLAEICSLWVAKGKRVYIEGRIQTREYEKDGAKVKTTEIVATDLILLDGGTPQSAPVAQRQTADGSISPAQVRQIEQMPVTDDLPF